MGFNEKGEIIRKSGPKRQTQTESQRPVPSPSGWAGAVLILLLVIGVSQWLSSLPPVPPVPPVKPAPVTSTPVLAPSKAAAPRRSVSERVADYSLATGSILPESTYGVLESMSGGEFIPVSYLYDGDGDPRKAAVLKAFTRANGRLYYRVTREQAYEFVRQQFDLRAIRQLGGKKPGPNDDIDQFIQDNHKILRGVTRALYEGRLSVYARVGDRDPCPRDFEIIFKSFGRPDLTNSLVRSSINHLQEISKSFPNVEYALAKMTDGELATLTGNPDFNTLSRAEQRAILTPILKRGPDAFAKNAPEFPAYNRVMINFYEDSFSMGNFGYYRSGEVDDTTMNTFNGRYGPPTEDMKMHISMRLIDRVLREIFGAAQAAMFFDQGGDKFNYDLTYDAAMTGLSDENKATLQKAMDKLVRPSLHTYHNFRPGFLDAQGAKYKKRVSANKSAF